MPLSVNFNGVYYNSTISLLPDGIQFSAADITNFCQSFENVPISNRDYTFSFLYTSNVPVRPFASKGGVLPGYLDFPATDTIQLGLLHFTLSGTGRFYVAIQNRETNAVIKLIAAKLELGPIQTLAHKEGDTWVLNDPPPNYALELAKCQRYHLKTGEYARIRASLVVPNTIQFFVPIPVTMRSKPSIIGTPILSGPYNNAQDGFTFMVPDISQNGVTVNANKIAHGLTDAILQLNNIEFSCDL